MKKILLLYTLITFFCYGYDYPYKNPFEATVLETPPEQMAIFEKKKYKEIKLDLENREIPANLWYLDKFKFGLMAQDEEAPLIFLFAGLGAKYNSEQMLNFARVLYQNGFSVIMLPTSFDYSYITNVSKNHAPGFLKRDSQEIYELMKLVLNKIEKKVEFKDIYVTGFSLGGTTSLLLGEIDNREKYFNFKRVLAINPSVDLFDSSKLLDDMLDLHVQNSKELDKLLNKVILGVIKFHKTNKVLNLDRSVIYPLFKQLDMSYDELETLVGVAFRFTSIDVNYIADLMTKSGFYTDPEEKVSKYQSMSEYYKKINYSNFQEYTEKIVFKTYQKENKDITLEELIDGSSLRSIENYLRTSNKVAIITNEDDLILTEDNLKYIKEVMKDRIKVFPHGGHCGNMFYTENVDFMINYLLGGELK